MCRSAHWLTAVSSVPIDRPIDNMPHSGQCYGDETAVWTLTWSADVSLFTLDLQTDGQITSCWQIINYPDNRTSHCQLRSADNSYDGSYSHLYSDWGNCLLELAQCWQNYTKYYFLTNFWLGQFNFYGITAIPCSIFTMPIHSASSRRTPCAI